MSIILSLSKDRACAGPDPGSWRGFAAPPSPSLVIPDLIRGPPFLITTAREQVDAGSSPAWTVRLSAGSARNATLPKSSQSPAQSAKAAGMSGAAYVVEGDTARATAHAAGPWHPDLQHGGAPASLVVWAAERVAPTAPMRVARVTVELLRPVPVAELAIRVATLREGRKIQLVEVRLLHDGTEVVRGTVLKVRTAVMPLPSGPVMPPLGAPPPAGLPATKAEFDFGFSARFELRRLTERGRLGPARIWFRQQGAIVEGEPLSPAMRAAAVGDYSNGIAAELPWNDWTFINADLTISLAREPEGEWILSDAESWHW
jgi:hypothetical protein